MGRLIRHRRGGMGLERRGAAEASTAGHARTLAGAGESSGAPPRTAATATGDTGDKLRLRHPPALVVLGNAQDLAQGRRLLGPGCAEPEVVEDPADRKLLSD